LREEQNKLAYFLFRTQPTSYVSESSASWGKNKISWLIFYSERSQPPTLVKIVQAEKKTKKLIIICTFGTYLLHLQYQMRTFSF